MREERRWLLTMLRSPAREAAYSLAMRRYMASGSRWSCRMLQLEVAQRPTLMRWRAAAVLPPEASSRASSETERLPWPKASSSQPRIVSSWEQNLACTRATLSQQALGAVSQRVTDVARPVHPASGLLPPNP